MPTVITALITKAAVEDLVLKIVKVLYLEYQEVY